MCIYDTDFHSLNTKNRMTLKNDKLNTNQNVHLKECFHWSTFYNIERSYYW